MVIQLARQHLVADCHASNGTSHTCKDPHYLWNDLTEIPRPPQALQFKVLQALSSRRELQPPRKSAFFVYKVSNYSFFLQHAQTSAEPGLAKPKFTLRREIFNLTIIYSRKHLSIYSPLQDLHFIFFIDIISTITIFLLYVLQKLSTFLREKLLLPINEIAQLLYTFTKRQNRFIFFNQRDIIKIPYPLSIITNIYERLNFMQHI
jgi:hypothetical protein